MGLQSGQLAVCRQQIVRIKELEREKEAMTEQFIGGGSAQSESVTFD